MKVSESAIISFLLIIMMLLFSCSTSYATGNIFMQCVQKHSNSISNMIYTPSNASFNSVLRERIKNQRFSTPRTPKPLAIVAIEDVSHISAAIVCAKQSGLQIRTRSGGHDFEGLSYTSRGCPFVIIDMFKYRDIDIDMESKTAWVQTGAIVGELYVKIAEASNVLGFPAGIFSSIGTGGHFSGGGYGAMMRKFGLTVDNIVDAQLVDANGRVLDRESMGEDIFWAIRGGGGASFGVIASWKIQLVPVPKIVTVFRINRTLEQGATDIVYQWQLVAHKLDRNLFLRPIPAVINITRGRKTVLVTFIAHFLGRAERLVRLLNDNLPILGLRQHDCIEMSWIESNVFWLNYPAGTSPDVLLDRSLYSGISSKSKSDYVKSPISKQGLEFIWKKFIEAEKIYMQWTPYGGRMDEIPASATPYPRRKGYIFRIAYICEWTEKGEQLTRKNINLVRSFYEAMTPFVTRSPREAYYNYRDIDIGSNPCDYTIFENALVYGCKYYKDNNFARLVRAKSQADPLNFFKNEQSIPPEPNYFIE